MNAAATDRETVHASCVAINGRAVLLCGVSGSGKSDLALRLLDRGAALISDDYTELRRDGDRLFGSAPASIVGKIEIRGIGIIAWPAVSEAPIALCLVLDTPVERIPEDPLPRRLFLGIDIPVLSINALEASAPIKVELALQRLVDTGHDREEGR
jgi:serine kinase of HPr protein (carbohydrate metabolism regulator)